MQALFPQTHGSSTHTGGVRGLACDPVDWDALRRATRACCCPAKPMVVAIIPPAPGRPRPVDLLLCLHHYRVSARALTTAGAELFGIDGTPLPGAARPMSAVCG